MKFRFGRVNYYVDSILVLLKNVSPEKWLRILFYKEIFLSRPKLVLGFVSFKDLLVIKEVIIDRDYEQEGVAVNKENKVIVDIGAGIGDFVITLAKQYPEINLYAYEPDTAYFFALQNNITRNNIRNVTPLKIAVNSLGEIFTHTNAAVDVLKIDCEGCEFSILSSEGAEYLKKVKNITMEYHLQYGKLEKLTGILHKSGFITTLKPQKDISGIGYLYAVKR